MKKHFVAAISSFLVFFVFVGQLQANSLAPSSRAIPYYGGNFYTQVSNGTENEQLKVAIKTVLRSYHVKKDNQMDQVVASCPSGGKDCYSHVAIGYGRARQFLMGFFYLVQQGNDYGIREVYCDRIYDKSDFRGGRGPGPNIVPDNTVINVEHTWPQSKFSGRFDKETQKSDLHHLFPSDSKVNGVRGNYWFGEVTREKGKLPCSASHFGDGDGVSNIFEPPDDHKGLVARALFYFSLRYDLAIPANQEVTLKKWHNENPVTDEELSRNDEIYKVQGNRNPFIDHPELVDSISDF